MSTPPRRMVWIDADIAIGQDDPVQGGADADDAWALVQVLGAPEVEVRGISTIFGQTSAAHATEYAQALCQVAGCPALPVYEGAAHALDIRAVVHTPGSLALSQALRETPMTLMMLGPLTNLATALLMEPLLASQIDAVLMVAGRRGPDQHFFAGDEQEVPFADPNFDLDPAAVQVLMQFDVPLYLFPFELAHKVWITPGHIDQLASGTPVSAWLARHSRDWAYRWERMGAQGVNPFDTLVSGYLRNPEGFLSDTLPLSIRLYPDDTQPFVSGAPRKIKPYLIASQDFEGLRQVQFFHTPPGDFVERLARDLQTFGFPLSPDIT